MVHIVNHTRQRRWGGAAKVSVVGTDRVDSNVYFLELPNTTFSLKNRYVP